MALETGTDLHVGPGTSPFDVRKAAASLEKPLRGLVLLGRATLDLHLPPLPEEGYNPDVVTAVPTANDQSVDLVTFPDLQAAGPRHGLLPTAPRSLWEGLTRGFHGGSGGLAC